MIIEITYNCDSCDGRGKVSKGNPNDPSGHSISCPECNGSGKEIIFEMLYDSVADAKLDYDDALSIEEVAGENYPDNLSDY
mgnify:CR=1 FL=1|tara:strand:- start:596 stop:838 length:243 start_codon:yes stop_codon:yes gene_type:complete